MLQSIKELYGKKLDAKDGLIGHVKDFYFDDKNWTIRYVVADTGAWLPARQVLISPHAFASFHRPGRLLSVNLTRKQIEDCPSIDSHKPVSRQYEEEYYKYFGWPYYWEGSGLWGMSGVPTVDVSQEPFVGELSSSCLPQPKRGDAHLRSAQAVNGYHIQASDRIIGHICDFLMDEQSWAICQLVVKTGNRFSGKEVQVSNSHVDRIGYDRSTVFVNETADAIEKSPEHELTPSGCLN